MYSISSPNCGNLIEYYAALKQGSLPAAYVRLMFLGPGGSGKSSLLAGLMNTPLPNEAESTVLVDTQSVSYKWISATEFTWKLHSDKDETRNLAAKARILANELGMESENIGVNTVAPAEQIFSLPENRVSSLQSGMQTADSNISRNISEVKQIYYKELVEQAKQGVEGTTEVVMHIWDCGGQPIFLDIISAFLTSRTMFLLLFDGSIDLNSMYQEKWHHKGKIFLGREQNTTHIQLMKQWLQLIHSSLVAKDNAYGQSEQSLTNQIATSGIPKCPRAMIIGTRGDVISSAKNTAVKKELNEACSEAAFGDIVDDKLIVDNTNAGKGNDGEDPGYKQIRENIHKFAESLKIPTPLAWIAFRQVLQKCDLKPPIISYADACIIAKECGIEKSVVPSVLHFYHQLGALLHYTDIPLLTHTIIVKPQWLIDQLRELLMPEWYRQRPHRLERLWKKFEEKGVLAENLYQELWQNCGLEGGGQAFMNLLDHFDLAKEISHNPDEIYDGKEYFMPCILRAQPKGMCMESVQYTRQAATLHICFKMGYVPPGFYVRFIARMTNHKECTLLPKKAVYRDSIRFKYRKIDQITISETLRTIEVNFVRKAMRKRHSLRFVDSCSFLYKELIDMCNEVHCWMPFIKFQLAFECTCSGGESPHFVFLKPDIHQESTLLCGQENECHLSANHKLWLPPCSVPLVNVS